tara:strand:+ start:23 stop:496 length:474 start_codon:yes stop_codon:yes gene_type:complete
MNANFAKHLHTRADRQSGFTLIELLVAMTVVGILTAIAVPSYGQYVLRSARADARATLLQASQFMERFYAVNSSYDQMLNGTAVVLPNAMAQSPASGTARYNIALQAGALGPNTYTLQAIPTGPSSSDKCGTLSLSSTGARGASGVTSPDDVADCWR